MRKKTYPLKLKSIVIDQAFLSSLKKIFDEEFKTINSKFEDKFYHIQTRIVVISKEESETEYDSFEDLISDSLPRDIKSLSIRFYNYDNKKEHLSISLRISNNSLESFGDVSGSCEETIARIKKRIEDVIEDSKTEYWGIYSLGETFPYIIAIFLSVFVNFEIFLILSNFQIKTDTISFIVYLSFLFFIFIFKTAINWLYPKINFDLRKHNKTMVKITKWILGIFVVAIIGHILKKYLNIGA